MDLMTHNSGMHSTRMVNLAVEDRQHHWLLSTESLDQIGAEEPSPQTY